MKFMRKVVEKLYDWCYDLLEFIKAPEWCFSALRTVKGSKYYIKRAFKNPNSIAPRTLSRFDYIDRGDLITHQIFEILRRFYDEEVNNGWVDWSHHKVKFGPNEKRVDEVWKFILDWWDYAQIRLDYDWKYFQDLRTSKFEINNEGYLKIIHVDDELISKLRDRHQKREEAFKRELEDNLITIIKTIDLMWT